MYYKSSGIMLGNSPAPLRKTKRNWAISVLTLATSKQKGDNALTGDPPNVVDNDNLKHPIPV
jgi:hypothetical protein